MIDWERILILLSVAEKSLPYPQLQPVHDAAIDAVQAVFEGDSAESLEVEEIPTEAEEGTDGDA